MALFSVINPSRAMARGQNQSLLPRYRQESLESDDLNCRQVRFRRDKLDGLSIGSSSKENSLPSTLMACLKRKEKKNSEFAKIPNEFNVLSIVLGNESFTKKHLSVDDLKNLRQVSRATQKLVDQSQFYWRFQAARHLSISEGFLLDRLKHFSISPIASTYNQGFSFRKLVLFLEKKKLPKFFFTDVLPTQETQFLKSMMPHFYDDYKSDLRLEDDYFNIFGIMLAGCFCFFIVPICLFVQYLRAQYITDPPEITAEFFRSRRGNFFFANNREIFLGGNFDLFTIKWGDLYYATSKSDFFLIVWEAAMWPFMIPVTFFTQSALYNKATKRAANDNFLSNIRTSFKEKSE